MTNQIPEEIGEPVDVDITYVPDEHGIKITLVLGEASVVVEHTWDGVQSAAILVQALPQALMQVQEALNQQEEE